jgi:hypothetical protein
VLSSRDRILKVHEYEPVTTATGIAVMNWEIMRER